MFKKIGKFFANLGMLMAPPMLFPVLFQPYMWLNRRFLVEWLGCGCPMVNEQGDVVYRIFNANDFSFWFWKLMAVAAGVLAFFLSKKVMKHRWWLRIPYILAVLALSFWMSKHVLRWMWWA